VSQARAIAFILQPQNDGQPYHIDNGHPTAWGWDLVENPDLTDADLRGMTQAMAAQRYAAKTWPAIHGDELPDALQTVVLNAAVLDGAEHAIRILQRALYIGADGLWGPATSRAVSIANGPVTVALFTTELILDYAADANFAKDGRGWVSRAVRAALDGS
jgi:lysozyme family protein